MKNKIKIIRKNIKHTYIRVKDGEIIVTTNFLTPKIYINSLIKNNINNIEKMLMKDRKLRERESDFYLFGKKYNVTYNESINGVLIEKNNIVTKDINQLNLYLDNIMKDKCFERISFWYNQFEENIPRPNLKIRKMKSRWGVCNTKNNNVTLNYYLYRYDLDCLDYVIVHELVHFIVGDHSKKFWSFVEKYYPDYKRIRKILRN